MLSGHHNRSEVYRDDVTWGTSTLDSAEIIRPTVGSSSETLNDTLQLENTAQLRVSNTVSTETDHRGRQDANDFTHNNLTTSWQPAVLRTWS